MLGIPSVGRCNQLIEQIQKGSDAGIWMDAPKWEKLDGGRTEGRKLLVAVREATTLEQIGAAEASLCDHTSAATRSS